MKKILLFATIAFSIASCQIEELSPEDVIEAPAWNDPGSNQTDPNSIVVPCVSGLTNNVIRFNNTNYGISSSTVNPVGAPLGLFNATYMVSANMSGSTEMEFYFMETPTSGYYATSTGGQMSSSNQVTVRTLQGGNYYYSDAGATVYVQDYTDSIVVSYCDIDLTGSFTFTGSKGKFTY